MTNSFSMRMMKVACILSVSACSLFVSCSRNHDSSSDADGAEVGDSIVFLPADSLPSKEETKSKGPKHRFANADAALDFMKSSPHSAKYYSGILPRMARENLEYCEKLLNNEYNHFIVVDKASMHVILYDKYGNVKRAYRMACARNYGTKHKKADCRTPEGFFTAGGVYDSREWLYTDDDGVTHPEKGVFGPRFVRIISPVTTQVGIHGTGSPWSVGKRTSHGCIRLANENILDLVKYVDTGMPIIVNPSLRDIEVNRREGYYVASIYTGFDPLEHSLPKENRAHTDSANLSNENDSVPAVAPSGSSVESDGVDTELKSTTPEQTSSVPDSIG